MLLTITYEGQNTEDLGFLLHKNPAKTQQFELSYGKAYVFYTEVSSSRTTAALLPETDPLLLARGKEGGTEGGLFDYVNDRPYASTSFMSTAIARVFGTAMSGRCDKRQQLADTPLRLTARLFCLRDNGEEELAKELFAPLGYTVETSRTVLDEKFPEWGMSPYIDLTISGTVRLSELLNHLYVLIPVFDRQKHYYISKDEIQKLLDHGKGWIEDHPYKEKIVRRYFTARKSYARKTLELLIGEENSDEETIANEENAAEKEARIPLNTQRMEAVKEAVLESGASSVIDLGCGECRLTSLLLKAPQIRKAAACDVSAAALEKAAKRLHLERMPSALKDKLTLFQASLTYRDKRFEGYDCACAVEVIEHIEPMRIGAFERVLFGCAVPKTVIITTPNREYNANYEHMKENSLRHTDHRFEWTRAEFSTWTENVCEKYGYSCKISGIGDTDEALGAPTQMGVFTKNE